MKRIYPHWFGASYESIHNHDDAGCVFHSSGVLAVLDITERTSSADVNVGQRIS